VIPASRAPSRAARTDIWFTTTARRWTGRMSAGSPGRPDPPSCTVRCSFSPGSHDQDRNARPSSPPSIWAPTASTSSSHASNTRRCASSTASVSPWRWRRASTPSAPWMRTRRSAPWPAWPGSVNGCARCTRAVCGAVGTSALREAANARAFLTRAEGALGHPIEVGLGPGRGPPDLRGCGAYADGRADGGVSPDAWSWTSAGAAPSSFSGRA
jgi:hypothetical protein